MAFPQINFKKIILVLAIVIVLNLFINYGIDTFYKQPKWDDFCLAGRSDRSLDAKDKCEAAGGKWTGQEGVDWSKTMKPIPVPAEQRDISVPAGWCDPDFNCRAGFEKVDNLYKRNVFIILVALGAAVLAGGFFVTQSEAVSLGLSFGGLVSIFIGTVRYWSAMDDYLRFVILGLTLAVLIWLGIKKFKNGESA